MLRFLLFLIPSLLSAAGGVDWAITLDPGRFDSQITADRQGSLIQARWGGDCSLPLLHPISACGPLWISKLAPDARSTQFATYLGDSGFDAGAAVFLRTLATDRAGNIYLLLSTSSAIFPLMKPLQWGIRGSNAAYLCKLAADGARLIYATYLGGTGNDLPQALALDDRGAAWILTFTSSTDFPVTPGAPSSTAVARAAITRFSPAGALEYSATIEYGLIAPSLQIDSTGAALLNANGRILRVLPDSGEIHTSGINSPVLSNWPIFLPSPNGDLWLTGSITNGLIPTTPAAAQPGSGPSAILRIVDGQTLAPDTIVAAHQVRAFAVDPADHSRVFAAADAGLLLSEDNGRTWDAVFSQTANAVAVDPSDSNVTWLGTPFGLYRSADRGHTWDAVVTPELPKFEPVTSVTADPQTPGVIYAAGRALYRSDDSGRSWNPYFFPSQPGFTPTSSQFTTPVIVRVDPSIPGRVYVSATSQCIGFCPVIPSLYRSEDNGSTFSRLPLTFTPGPAPDFAIAKTTGDVFVLNDAKLTAYRNAAFDQPELLELNTPQALTIDPETDTLYVSLADGGILRSEDGGRTWTVAGRTPAASPHLIVSASGTIQAAQPVDATDGFLLRYDTTGALQYGTYFGGGATNVISAAVGPDGQIFLAGATMAGLPLQSALQTDYGGGDTDGFAARFDASGSLLSSTYLGATSADQIQKILALDDGSVVVIGQGTLAGAGPLFAARLHW